MWYNVSIMENADKHKKNRNFDWLKAYEWKKGQSGNPKGRPKTRTLKEYAREFLSTLTDEQRIEYFKGLDNETVWKMAEGNPETRIDTDLNIKVEKLNNLVKATRELLK